MKIAQQLRMNASKEISTNHSFLRRRGSSTELKFYTSTNFISKTSMTGLLGYLQQHPDFKKWGSFWVPANFGKELTSNF